MMKQIFLLVTLALFFSEFVLAQGNACLPALHVDGKWIKDENGNQVTLHGVNIYLQGTSCLDTPQEMLDMIDHSVDAQGFGEAKVIRLALIGRFVSSNYAKVYLNYIRPAIDHCKKKKLYLIVYYHTFPNKYGNTFQDLIDFWEYTAPLVANDDNILLACANEPVYSRDLAGFNVVRKNMQKIVNTIRKSAKKQIIIAQGTSWTNYIAPYADNPLNDPAKSFNNGQDNIMYEAHIYPHNWSCQANGSQKKWNQMVGKVPDKFPVLIGEWSPISTNGCNTNQQAYFNNFVDWLSKKPNVSATAWNLGNCGDHHIMLNSDKSLNQWGQDWKNFVKKNTYNVSCQPPKPDPDPTASLPQIGQTIWLQSNVTGKYVTVNNNKLYANHSTHNSINEHFSVAEAGSGRIRLKSVTTNSYVKALSGNPTGQLTADGGSDKATQWEIKDAGNSLIRFKSYVNLNHMMADNNNTNKPVTSNGGSGSWAEFSWGVVEKQPEPPQPPSGYSGYYVLKNRASGLNLRNADCESKLGTLVELYDGTGDCAQWEAVDAGEGYYLLKNKQSGLYLNNKDCATKAGALLQIYEGTWHCSQWKLVDAGGGYVHLQNRYAGLNARNQNCQAVSDQTQVELVTGTGNCAQWQLIPVGNARVATKDQGKAAVVADEVSNSKPLVQVYPNPSTSKLIINLTEGGSQEVQLVNLQGQILVRTKLSEGQGQLDVSALPRGLYLVKAGEHRKRVILK